MSFQVGSWVKFKSVSPIRLGYALTDVGQVVGVHDGPETDHEIDVEFGDGQVVHGADGEWFEAVEVPEAAEH
jgi:hypothetical protein